MKENSSPPELNLLMRLQNNDEQALALLMERYYTELFNYAASFNRDETLVKDCIQEVFISLWQRRESATSILSPKYYQHLDHGQIAGLMNISAQSLYNLLHETIQKLKTVWHAEFVLH